MADDIAGKLVYLVVGEASGDLLGADLITAMRLAAPDVRCAGLAGPRMQALGLNSLFDIEDISVMGFSAVVGRLPTLLNRIARTVRDIVEKRPDVLVLIDSPDFTHRVAKRVRAKLPGIVVIKYICPSVWAWRQGRAKTMAAYIDHVLAVLPFEPALLAKLHGPKATYIGHPMAMALSELALPNRRKPAAEKTLLLLPGSRRSELRLLFNDFRETLELLHERGNRFRALLPAVPKLEAEIRRQVANWKIKPEIVTGEPAKHAAFLAADAALATSGTVLLELALYQVPMISIYRLDWLLYRFRFLIKAWTGALPNLIADAIIVPERVGDMVRAGWLARAIEGLICEGSARNAQIEGFERVASRMHQSEPASVIAARKILEMAGWNRPAG